MARHCSDCIYSYVQFDTKTQRWQASCSRGYSLTNPKVKAHTSERFFALRKEDLVPTIDPFGKEYLRSSNVCEHYSSSLEYASHVQRF